MVNNCDEPVSPGIVSNSGGPGLQPTGFTLQKGESKTVTAPSNWAGMVWGRTNCANDQNGVFSCLTGDCASQKVECNGAGGIPPFTSIVFNLAKDVGGLDYVYVNLVNGFNLPVSVTLKGGTESNCTEIGCIVDVNEMCPMPLRVVNSNSKVLACKSECLAFGQPQYCCTGDYASAVTCKPSPFAQASKSACPRAKTYPYGEETSTSTCIASDYNITFCSPSTSEKQPVSAGTTDSDGAAILKLVIVLVGVIASLFASVGLNCCNNCCNGH